MTATFESIYMEFQSVLDSIANRFGNQNARWGASNEDFRQEGIAWMLENERKLGHQLEDLGAEAFERYFATCLNNLFYDVAFGLREQAGGQDRQSAYFYSTQELKLLLPSVFDRNKWLEPPQYDDSSSRSKGIPSHGNNWVTTLADVSRAFDLLEPEDQHLLRRYHVDGVKNMDMAAQYEITEAAMSSRHTAVLKKLQARLGGEKPKRDHTVRDPFKGRHAISNAQARAVTASHYEAGE